jgi:hypothetical protein
LFAYHEYPVDEQFDLINSLPLAAQLRAINSNLKELPSGAGNTNMSLRQILRVLRIAGGEELRLRNTIRRTLMVDCLPNHMKIPINEVLGSESSQEASSLNQSVYEIFNSQAYIRCNARMFIIRKLNHRCQFAHTIICRIGDVKLDKKLDSHPALVPNVVFHDMQCHVKILKDMLTDWSCGENCLLLIGNQGVGKNKLADKLVQMLNYEREYIQVSSHSPITMIFLISVSSSIVIPQFTRLRHSLFWQEAK